MSARRSSKHSQRGVSMGVCPNCLQPMWRGQATVITPVKKDDGTYDAILAHSSCDAKAT